MSSMAGKNRPGENSTDKRYDDFLAQDDLNLVVNGVCDLFDYAPNGPWPLQQILAAKDLTGNSARGPKATRIIKIFSPQ